MRIGGTDVVIPMLCGPESAVDAVKNIFRLMYPAAIIEPGDANREAFCYVNQTAKDVWDKGECGGNDMVHVLASDGSLTLVVDDEAKWADLINSAKQWTASNWMLG